MEPVVATSPDDLLNALPHVLGFEPRESIIAVPFRALGGTPTARVDIPRTAEDQRQVISALRNAYARNARPGALVAIVCITDDRRAAERTSGDVCTALELAGISVSLRLWATDQRWVELNSGQAGIRTSDSARRIAAEAAYAGVARPAPTRQALADALVGDHAPVAAVLDEARQTAQVSGTRAEHLWAVGRLAQFHDDGVRLTDSEAARLLVALEHKPTRDALWTDMSRANATTHVTLWTDLTRRAPDEVRTPAATMLAFSSWLNGDGAKAWCALDQIPADGPPYLMAALLATALQNAISPATWEEARATIEDSELFVPNTPRPGRGVPGPAQAPARRPPAV
jgi:hypothetical protein